jgi:hypothetical protein
VCALHVQWHSTAQTLEVACTTLHYSTLHYSTVFYTATACTLGCCVTLSMRTEGYEGNSLCRGSGPSGAVWGA